tara:strand:+ start:82 stop:789 length:708 start_codon:yes stop_codon:yes gene_type:complete
MNKIIEILEKKEKETKRTGSMWDWQEGYPESQWKILCQLENGHFFEDEKNLIFYTTENEKIGFEAMPEYNQDKKDFISAKTSESITYWSTDKQITKSLTEDGVFEITDRVGHYIKLRVEPMVKEVSTVTNDFKSVRLTSQELPLLYIALSKNLFNRPKKGQVYYESHRDSSCTLYLKADYHSELESSMLMAQYQGKFRQSNAEFEWNNLKNKIDEAQISDKENIKDLELYGVYDE